MPPLIRSLFIISLAACDAAPVDQASQAVATTPVTLAECVASLAADVHAACTDVGPPPSGPGTAPSADGFVAAPDDDPLGVEASLPEEPRAKSPAVDVHCKPDAVPALVAARGAAFRQCLRDRTDKGAGCADIGDVACPPGLDDDECAGVREAADALCHTEVASL
jgi:hypothetical protein